MCVRGSEGKKRGINKRAEGVMVEEFRQGLFSRYPRSRPRHLDPPMDTTTMKPDAGPFSGTTDFILTKLRHPTTIRRQHARYAFELRVCGSIRQLWFLRGFRLVAPPPE